MPFTSPLNPFVTAGLLICLSSPTHAGIVLGGTRVILREQDREVSIPAKNISNAPYVVQAWGESDTPGVKVPFIVTPPLSRLEPGMENLLRILRTSGDLPKDRESVFRLNVKEIPEKARQENVLQIAVRTRIKLFYRPAGLPGRPDQARTLLKWAVDSGANGQGAVLRISNASAYHITFTTLSINQGQQLINPRMVPPQGEVAYPLTTIKTPQTIDVSYTTLNDYGGETPREHVVVPASTTPVPIKAEPAPEPEHAES